MGVSSSGYAAPVTVTSGFLSDVRSTLSSPVPNPITMNGGVLIGRALDALRPHLDRPDGCIDGQPAEEALHGVIVDGVCSLVAEAAGGLADDDPRLTAVAAAGLFRVQMSRCCVASSTCSRIGISASIWV